MQWLNYVGQSNKTTAIDFNASTNKSLDLT